MRRTGAPLRTIEADGRPQTVSSIADVPLTAGSIADIAERLMAEYESRLPLPTISQIVCSLQKNPFVPLSAEVLYARAVRLLERAARTATA